MSSVDGTEPHDSNPSCIIGPIRVEISRQLLHDVGVNNNSNDNNNVDFVEQTLDEAGFLVVPAARTRAQHVNYCALTSSSCCSKRCLKAFDISFLKVCRIRYYSMSQEESRTWLRTLMENQPSRQRKFVLANKVGHYSNVSSPILHVNHSVVFSYH